MLTEFLKDASFGALSNLLNYVKNCIEFVFALVRDLSPCHSFLIFCVFLREGMCQSRFGPRILKAFSIGFQI